MYQHLTDEQLLAEITAYRDAVRSARLGGGVSRVAGEGRSMTIMGTDVTGCVDEIRRMEAAAISRGLDGFVATGGSITVEIG